MTAPAHHRVGDDAPDDLADALRGRGLRMTRQRDVVLAAVRRLGHATPEELAAEVDGVDLATVYRTLDLLEELGFVSHAHFGHGAPSYRPAQDDHVHVVCHRCGRVVDEDVELIGPLVRALRDRHGFETDVDHFTVFGRCADCGGDDGPVGTAVRTADAAAAGNKPRAGGPDL